MIAKPYIYCLAQRFEQIVAKYESKTAIQFSEVSGATYGQLNREANRIAHLLLGKGVEKGAVVGLFNNKSLQGYAAMLACIKIGAIYVNLDVSSPPARVAKILAKASPVLLLSDFPPGNSAITSLLQGLSPELVYLQKLGEQQLSVDNPNRQREITGQDPAYLMFTSGSTGFPKGAAISHQNVLNFIGWGITTFQITHNDRLTNVNPIYFDNSVFDFYLALFTGATLVPFSQAELANPKVLVAKVDALKCTVWFSVPSLLVYLLVTRVLNEENFRSLRAIIFGGEGFPKPKLKKLFGLYHPRVQLFNVYGPTECTCICSSYLIGAADFEDMKSLAPLGLLAPNFDYEILPLDEEDPSFGELCLKGPNVGLGYYRDPEQTRRSFIQNPFQDAYPEIVYKTGDLVRKASNGHLHFKGRADHQVKHLGYRIELEEIEAGFATLPYINEVAVLYQRLEEGLGKIVAFASLSEVKKEKDILAEMKRMLPAHMVPRQLFILSQLPKNKNGKIDKVQLMQRIDKPKDN